MAQEIVVYTPAQYVFYNVIGSIGPNVIPLVAAMAAAVVGFAGVAMLVERIPVVDRNKNLSLTLSWIGAATGVYLSLKFIPFL